MCNKAGTPKITSPSFFRSTGDIFFQYLAINTIPQTILKINAISSYQNKKVALSEYTGLIRTIAVGTSATINKTAEIAFCEA